jgi:hypothetical protein
MLCDFATDSEGIVAWYYASETGCGRCGSCVTCMWVDGSLERDGAMLWEDPNCRLSEVGGSGLCRHRRVVRVSGMRILIRWAVAVVKVRGGIWPLGQ